MTASETARIGELLDEAIEAVNRGDLTTAHTLAELVLIQDSNNRDAGDLLAAEASSNGELRRLTILCCDLVGSTELSERQEPERYRTLVRRYQTLCRETIQARYDGHIVSVKGDGLLALFGYPTAHEDDTRRGVHAGLELCRAIRQLSEQAERQFGEALDVRVGLHRGLVFVDTEEDDVYGLAANLASRVEGLADPGSVVITEEVRSLVGDYFEVTEGAAQSVKGFSETLRPFTVVAERAEPPDHRFATPLIGRSREFEVLRGAWSASRAGAGPTTDSVLIRGEPGIGKSRLAAALKDHVRVDGGTVVHLDASLFHAGAGFHPVQILLEARCGIDADTDGGERLQRLRHELGARGMDPDVTAPLLAPILGLAPRTGYEPVAAEGRKLNDDITSAVYEYLVACFDGGPGLLLVEDVQWLDASTVSLLSRVLAEGPGALIVVLTSREDAPFAVRTALELQPLQLEECVQLAEALQPEGLSPDERKVIAERSDGIPLYLEELVRGWESGASEAYRGGEAVPDALYEPLVARLLSTTAGVAVAGAAATIGRELDRALLDATLDLSPEQIDRELDALSAARILVTTNQRGDKYRFRHELLRGVAYDLQPPALRRRLHERVADHLVLGADSDEAVDWTLAATHYERARRPEQAATAYAHAADRARRRGALTEARTQLGRSIELIAALPEDRERIAREVSLRLRRGFLAMSAEGAGSAEAASDYARCLELAMTDAQGDEMFSSLISLWAYHLSRAELGHAKDVLETLRPGLSGAREWFRPVNRAGFGMICWFEGDFAASREILEASARDITCGPADTAVDEVWFVPNDPIASIHTHLALARFMCGDAPGADAEMERSTGLTTILDFPQGPWSTAYGMWLRSWMLAERGDLDHADSVVADLIRLGARHGFDNWTMIATTQQAAIAAARAEQFDAPGANSATVDQAAALAGLVGMWEALELRVFLPYYLTMTGAALVAAGDEKRARNSFEDAIALGELTGMRFYAAEASRRLANLADGASAVDAELRSALELAHAQGARPFELRIALDLHDLRGAAALPLVDAAIRGISPTSVSADVTAARARLARGE